MTKDKMKINGYGMTLTPFSDKFELKNEGGVRKKCRVMKKVVYELELQQFTVISFLNY